MCGDVERNGRYRDNDVSYGIYYRESEDGPIVTEEGKQCCHITDVRNLTATNTGDLGETWSMKEQWYLATVCNFIAIYIF